MKNNLKKIIELYSLDWKRIFHNKLTLILIILLMIIPSLYAWFNIAALWDPYSNTGDIEIAVYSGDETAEVMSKKVNVGEELVKNLRKNKTIGWRFVDSKKELTEGVKTGKYYAGIYLPANFSEDLLSFVNGDITKPKIEYYVNQKINAIAPKVTDSAAKTIKQTISSEFIDTVSKTVVDIFNDIGYDLDSNLVNIQKISSKILLVDDNMSKIDGYTKEVLNLQMKMPEYKEKLAKANEFIAYLPEVDKVADKVVEVDKMMPQVKESGKLVVDLQKKIPEIENAGKQVAMIDEDFGQIEQMMSEVINEANQGIEIINDAEKVLPDVQKLAVTANRVIPDLKKQIQSVQEALPQISTAVDSGIKLVITISGDINNLAAKLDELTPEDKENIKNILTDINNDLEHQSQVLANVIQMFTNLRDLTENANLKQFFNEQITKFTNLKNGVDDLHGRISNAIANVDNLNTEDLKQLLGQIQTVTKNVSDLLNSVSVNEITNNVNTTLTDIQQMLGNAGNITGTIVDDDLINRIGSLMESSKGTIQEAVVFLEKYQKELPAVHNEIHSANELLNGNMTTIVGAINKAADIYNNDLPDIENKLNKASAFAQNDWPAIEKDLRNTMTMVNEKMPEVESALNMAATMIKQDWPNVKQGIHKAAGLIRQGQKDVDLKEIIKLLKKDATAESDFISNPVELSQKDMYPIPNYGSASTPFYTALCLWVGALLLSSAAATDFTLDTERQKKRYSKRQQYVARWMTFMTVGVFQALIVSLGDLLLLGTYSKNPVWFVLFSILTGFCFMTMVYVLAALFGNLGKGIAIIILVLSISAGGGNFPIQMSGKFFRVINPLLPFTHAVNLLREAVGGLYWPSVHFAAMILFLVGVGFFVLGLLVFPKVRGFFKKLNNYLHKGYLLH